MGVLAAGLANKLNVLTVSLHSGYSNGRWISRKNYWKYIFLSANLKRIKTVQFDNNFIPENHACSIKLSNFPIVAIVHCIRKNKKSQHYIRISSHLSHWFSWCSEITKIHILCKLRVQNNYSVFRNFSIVFSSLSKKRSRIFDLKYNLRLITDFLIYCTKCLV